MPKQILGVICFVILISVLPPAPTYAQTESRNKLAQKADWSLFSNKQRTLCWIVAPASSSKHTKNGRRVSVKRGVILLFVSFYPRQNIAGQISFSSGYPFADGSGVNVKIGSSSFELFTLSREEVNKATSATNALKEASFPLDETAWAATSADDRKIITAMKRGKEAILTGLSSRGTKTTDRFSLIGFTAAYEEAEEKCQK